MTLFSLCYFVARRRRSAAVLVLLFFFTVKDYKQGIYKRCPSMQLLPGVGRRCRIIFRLSSGGVQVSLAASINSHGVQEATTRLSKVLSASSCVKSFHLVRSRRAGGQNPRAARGRSEASSATSRHSLICHTDGAPGAATGEKLPER